MANWEDMGTDDVESSRAYYNNRTRCIRCGEVAVVTERPAGDECVCEFGSCDECGVPYPSAAQRDAAACAQCESDVDAMIARAQNAKTQEVPIIADFTAEGLRRMGVRS